MKVYFTCSTAEFNKYKDTYFEIRNLLVDLDHTLTRDWLAKTESRINNNQIEIEDIEEIYQGCMKAINEADVVIIEDTVSNFSTGHQITVALQRQKPVLVLWSGNKHRHFKKMFIHGIKSNYLEVHQYNKDNMSEIIKTFLNKYEYARAKNRFHLVLDNVERSYLDWAEFNKDSSRTSIIRDAIRKEIEQDDEYRKYLAKKS